MNFIDFCNYVKENILNYMPSEYKNADVLLDTTTKNNSVIRYGISIFTGQNNMVPKVYLESFYEQYNQGKNIQDIMQDLSKEYVRNIVPESSFIAENVYDFSKIKNLITTKIVNAKQNKLFVKSRPHKKIDDLVCFYQISINNFLDGRITIPISNELLKHWEISNEELHKLAVENTEKMYPSELKDITQTLFGQPKNYLDDPKSYLNEPMLVLTNKENIGGSSILANNNILEKVSKVVNDDYYILPSSIHELLIIPKNMSKEMNLTEQSLGVMVRDVNVSQVDTEEQLSDHAYSYCKDTKELSTCKNSRLKEREMER